MPSNMDRLIAKAKELAQKGNSQDAISLANELAQRHPNETGVWVLRGYLRGLSGNHAEAVSDLTRAIQINGTDPYLFFTRGVDRFELKDDQSAIDDFTRGLELCRLQENDDYRETLLFWRAEALLRLGKKQRVLSDLANVRDGFSFWTYRLRTKADLLADCKNLPD